MLLSAKCPSQSHKVPRQFEHTSVLFFFLIGLVHPGPEPSITSVCVSIKSSLEAFSEYGRHRLRLRRHELRPSAPPPSSPSSPSSLPLPPPLPPPPPPPPFLSLLPLLPVLPLHAEGSGSDIILRFMHLQSLRESASDSAEQMKLVFDLSVGDCRSNGITGLPMLEGGVRLQSIAKFCKALGLRQRECR